MSLKQLYNGRPSHICGGRLSRPPPGGKMYGGWTASMSEWQKLTNELHTVLALCVENPHAAYWRARLVGMVGGRRAAYLLSWVMCQAAPKAPTAGRLVPRHAPVTGS